MSKLTITMAAAVAAVALALSGCSTGASDAASSSPEASSTAQSDQGTWPRTITHEAGETTIDAKPKRIVSTSVTLTGTLLAIKAPVVASAATTPSDITDDKGFFGQWSQAAADANVEVLYPNLEFDEEAVLAADPDLIVVAATGADATADQYEKLSAIAPTIVLNYGSESWQDLAGRLGEATGEEEAAANTVSSFNDRVAEVKSKLTIEDPSANVVVWNGTAKDTAFAKPGSPHADLLDSLGFSVAGAPDGVDTSTTKRNDFAFVSLENTVTALTGANVFVASGGDETVKDMTSASVLRNAPAVANDKVLALGNHSFRIDYYSALEIVDIVEGAYA